MQTLFLASRHAARIGAAIALLYLPALGSRLGRTWRGCRLVVLCCSHCLRQVKVSPATKMSATDPFQIRHSRLRSNRKGGHLTACFGQISRERESSNVLGIACRKVGLWPSPSREQNSQQGERERLSGSNRRKQSWPLSQLSGAMCKVSLRDHASIALWMHASFYLSGQHKVTKPLMAPSAQRLCHIVGCTRCDGMVYLDCQSRTLVVRGPWSVL